MEVKAEGSGDEIHRNIGHAGPFNVRRGNRWRERGGSKDTADKVRTEKVRMPVLEAPRTSRFHRGRAMPRRVFDYEIIDCIGQGAGSLIYVVSHEQTHQLYALKHVVKRQEKDARFIDQLDNDYQISRQFTHPSLRRSIAISDD